jgi:uncharacterized membrane protein
MQIPKRLYFHPMFVHFPQALFPMALLLFGIYLFTGNRDFEVGAYLSLTFGLLIAPITIITGFLDWKFRYKAYLTRVFKIKIIGSFTLVAIATPAVLLRALIPDVTALPLAAPGWVYAGLLAACVLNSIVLGYYGGKLVFH